MNINIICVGKLKEKYWTDAVNEYLKRLKIYANVKVIEVLDEKAPENLSSLQIKQLLKKEGERILKNIHNGAFLITLDIEGKNLSSEELAEFLNNKMANGVSNITFVIGGSLGIYEDIKRKANFSLSFSRMTFPHQLMRVILLEQIYRAEKIIRHEPYRK